MHKNAMKCNKTLSKWCKNKHEASKIIYTFETYQRLNLGFLLREKCCCAHHTFRLGFPTGRWSILTPAPSLILLEPAGPCFYAHKRGSELTLARGLGLPLWPRWLLAPIPTPPAALLQLLCRLYINLEPRSSSWWCGAVLVMLRLPP
jgi:hypothetical protein